MKLKFVVPHVTVGIVVRPSQYYQDDGVPALRGLNVRPGRLLLDDVVYISEAANSLHRKSRLRAGDVVVVRTGKAGAACVVPPELDGANCVDLLVIRQSSNLDSKYLEYVINSDFVVEQISLRSVGSLQAHFNTEALRNLTIPMPPIEEQHAIATLLDRETKLLDAALAQCLDLRALLTEQREAHISAAIAGNLREAANVAAV
jgi:type I restriction enzyme S subunit